MRPSLVTAASISVMRLGPELAASRCSSRSSTHLTGRPVMRRRDRRQHDVGKHRQLDAEASAAVRRDAQPQLRPGHAQRARHHRMRAERALKVRQHVVAAVARTVLGDDDVAFHRRERVARIFAGERDDGRRPARTRAWRRRRRICGPKSRWSWLARAAAAPICRRRRADRSPPRAAHSRCAPGRRRPRRDSGSPPPPSATGSPT